MAVERRNPLPPGTYWIDVFGENRLAFSAWRAANAEHVKIASTESFDSDPPRDWVKFEVSAPVEWEALRFGFPTIIGEGAKVESSADTVERPAPERDLFDTLGTPEQQEALARTAAAAAGVVTGLGLLWLVYQVVSAAKGGRGKQGT